MLRMITWYVTKSRAKSNTLRFWNKMISHIFILISSHHEILIDKRDRKTKLGQILNTAHTYPIICIVVGPLAYHKPGQVSPYCMKEGDQRSARHGSLGWPYGQGFCAVFVDSMWGAIFIYSLVYSNFSSMLSNIMYLLEWDCFYQLLLSCFCRQSTQVWKLKVACMF